MKKALAVLIAIAAVLSLNVVAFADGVPEGMEDNFNRPSHGIEVAPHVPEGNMPTIPGREPRNFDYLDGVMHDDGVMTARDLFNFGAFSLEMNDDDYLSIGENEMFYVWARNSPNNVYPEGSVLLPGTVLRPGEDYRFHIYVATVDAGPVPAGTLIAASGATRVTRAMLNGGNMRVRTVRGSSAIAAASIREVGSGEGRTYQLDLRVRESYGTRLADVEYAVEIVGGTNAAPVRSSVAFQIGFPRMTDRDIEMYSEGDIVVVFNDRPVITRDQFNDLARAFNFRNVTFENEDASWTFTTRVSGMSDANFYNTHQIVPSVAIDNPDADFKFWNFHGGVRAPANGELRLDVSDISGHFERMYVYISQGGALTPIAAVHDRETDEIVFRTNYLGTFVVADMPLTSTVAPPAEPNLPYQPGTPQPPGGGTNNPPTGAGSAMGLLTLLGIAGIAGSGIAFRGKRK